MLRLSHNGRHCNWKSSRAFVREWSKAIRLGKEVPRSNSNIFVESSRTIFLRHHPFWFRVCWVSSCSGMPTKASASLRCKPSRSWSVWWQTFGCLRADRTHVGSSAEASLTARCVSSSRTLCNFPERKRIVSLLAEWDWREMFYFSRLRLHLQWLRQRTINWRFPLDDFLSESKALRRNSITF